MTNEHPGHRGPAAWTDSNQVDSDKNTADRDTEKNVGATIDAVDLAQAPVEVPILDLFNEKTQSSGAHTIDWFAAGQRDWDLSMITAAHSDDDHECEQARDERDGLRAHLDDLGEHALRDYLHGLLSQLEDYIWHGLAFPRS